MTLDPLTIVNAPEQARPLLEKAKAKYGFVPNLLGVMAHAPATLEAYMTLSGLFDKISLSPTERQVVLLAISAESECKYCVSAHTVIAQMQKVDANAVEAIRAGKPIGDDKLEAVRRFAVEVVSMRGWPSEGQAGLPRRRLRRSPSAGGDPRRRDEDDVELHQPRRRQPSWLPPLRFVASAYRVFDHLDRRHTRAAEGNLTTPDRSTAVADSAASSQ